MEGVVLPMNRTRNDIGYRILMAGLQVGLFWSAAVCYFGKRV
jgi:hypothetical protein